MMHSFFLQLKLGEPVSRIQPEELLLYAKPSQWEEYCDEHDRLALDRFLRYGSVMMKFFLVVALGGLIAAAVLGLSRSDESDEDEDKHVAMGAILGFAALVSFPFILAAVLNCYQSSVSWKLVKLCRSYCDEWAASKGVMATVEEFNLSEGDEGHEKVLVKFYDKFEVETGTSDDEETTQVTREQSVNATRTTATRS